MSGVTVKIDSRKWTAALRKAPAMIRVGAKNALGAIGKEVSGQIAKNGLAGRPGLKRRTGTLKNSLITVPSVEGKADKMWVGFVLPGARYAGIHETGGVIRAGSKLLAIPVGPALTPAGVPKYPGPRSVPDLVFLPKRGGGLLGKFKVGGKALGGDDIGAALENIAATKSRTKKLVAVFGKGQRSFSQKTKLAQFQVWYVLKKEVRIPPRLNFFRTWRAFFAGPRPAAIIKRELGKVVRLINGVP